LTSVSVPSPTWPAPEMVLSALVSVSVAAAPKIRLLLWSVSVTAPLPLSVTPEELIWSSVLLPAEFRAIVPELLIVVPSTVSA
jgi:hypothetical protein